MGNSSEILKIRINSRFFTQCAVKLTISDIFQQRLLLRLQRVVQQIGKALLQRIAFHPRLQLLPRPPWPHHLIHFGRLQGPEELTIGPQHPIQLVNTVKPPIFGPALR